jgi:hypothetical protein
MLDACLEELGYVQSAGASGEGRPVKTPEASVLETKSDIISPVPCATLWAAWRLAVLEHHTFFVAVVFISLVRSRE